MNTDQLKLEVDSLTAANKHLVEILVELRKSACEILSSKLDGRYSSMSDLVWMTEKDIEEFVDIATENQLKIDRLLETLSNLQIES